MTSLAEIGGKTTHLKHFLEPNLKDETHLDETTLGISFSKGSEKSWMHLMALLPASSSRN